MVMTETAPVNSAVRDGLGVGVAVGLSGLAYGAAAVAAGVGVAQTCALSLVAFSGASQFALVGVVAGGGNLIAGAVGAVLLGGRNALYGLRLADTLGVRGLRRLVTAHLVIDETTAVATAQPDQRSARAGFWATAISIFFVWNLATLLGAAGAARLGDPKTFGLDVVGPAAFLALLWPRLRPRVDHSRPRVGSPRPPRGATPLPLSSEGEVARKGGGVLWITRAAAVLGRDKPGGTERTVALLAGVIALASTPFLPSGVPIMLAAVATLAGIRGGRR